MMAMKHISLHANNSAAVRTHQRSQNIVHCISLDRQYNIARAREGQSLHMQNIATKSGVAQAAPAALLPAAMTYMWKH